ncbi:MAG: S8 family serine peptidase [Planctomycetes bacterium]|nr:S8 family serine peptidase [Planctomycetota bacterium]
MDGDGGDPPRGMVIVFASGNGIDRNDDGIFDNDGAGAQLSPGEEMATLPSVIGVGASTDRDLIASYSNYGTTIDVLAPGGDDFASLTTTDVRDDAGFVDGGFNIGGLHIDGPPDIDASGSYSGLFQGTSAACPIAAGVAALTLSINSKLSATDVRRILEHTSTKVSPTDADYHGVTNRSMRYGYGRIDAEAAVIAAQQSIINGGRTWPGRPAGVVISTETGQLQWLQNGDPLEFREPDPNADRNGASDDIMTLRTTDEFLVLQSDSPIDFIPEDGKCYSKEQIGCGSVEPNPLPTNVIVFRVGCSLVCGTGSTGACEAGARQCVGFLLASGTKYFAIYARSSIGRYSFGVSADTNQNIVDSGQLPPRAEAGTIPGGGTDPDVGPKVSIQFSPREGTSPLVVSFQGNASSVLPIDDNRTSWDFDIDDSVSVDAVTRNASHTYLLEPGESPTNQKTFIARLTMFDVEGNIGFAQAAIAVTAAGIDPNTGADEDVELRIVISVPGSVGSNIDSGQSPLAVELSIDAGEIVGTVESVRWDLGDGTLATSRFVSHTYVNNTGISLRIPITATVTIRTGSNTSTRVVSRRITVASGDPFDDTEDHACTVEDGCGAVGPGGTGAPCGVMGVIPMLFSLISLLWIRRSRNSAY